MSGPSTFEDLFTRAEADVASGWLPACQLAVAKDGALVRFEAFGQATTDTRFCTFSAIKPVVASALWLLIGDGLLETEATVSTYVPEFKREGKENVTVSQVLLHTAGFPRAPMRPEEGAEPKSRRERFASWRLSFEPGTRFEYHAGSAHWVLADLIERLSGIDYRDFIEREICAPLGIARLLGVGPEAFAQLAPTEWVGQAAGQTGTGDLSFAFDSAEVAAMGVPGAGGIATAGDLALFYQGLLHNPGSRWDAAVLADVTGTIRCTFPDPLLSVPVNRSHGLVIAGDDGQHFLRYAAFGTSNSPGSFGHAGVHLQVAWADPASGISFAYLTNGLDTDVRREGVRAVTLSSLAASLAF